MNSVVPIRKVVHLTSVHPRYDTRVFLKECRSLAAAGYDVTLIVADGKGDEKRDGVCIVDVGKVAGRARRMFGTVNRVRAVAVSLQADVYHLHDPELLRISGRLREVGNGARVIFDSHEDVPRQILSKQWIPALLRQPTSLFIALIESYVARRLSGIVAATPHISERFQKINANTVDINNYPMPDELAPASMSRSIRKRQICYVGGITKTRGIEVLIRALPLVPDVKLVLCGAFQEPEFERNMRALPGWSQVEYRGQVDREGVKLAMAESTAGMVTLLPTPAYIDALPVKMFEYMSAGLPVIASDFLLWRHILDAANAGVCVDPESPEDIATAIRELLVNFAEVDRMGKAGRDAVLEKYNWPNEAKKLVGFYKGLQ